MHDKEAIKVLPKRKIAIEWQDGKREIFWGLMVVERRSVAIGLAYLFLLNLPGVIFFFLWIFPLGHQSDLQNAAVPVGVSLSLSLSFLSYLYISRDDN